MLICRIKLPLKYSLALTIVLLLTACSLTPRALTRAKPAFAPAPAQNGILAEVETGLQAHHGKEGSGFRLLDSNADGLEWRLALIDSAQQSLDLQYYLWYGDQSGLLLMHRTIAAANRGVYVRILIDDLDTILRDAATPELRDHPFAAINSHPNIEIRLFNPWNARMLLGRAYELLIEMERLNQRMHNKLMVADNRAAIIGGRNLGDEYLGLNSNFNFHDLDVLGVGPVARQSSTIFDRFWNSKWVMPVTALQEPLADHEVDNLRAQMLRELQSSAALAGTPLEPVDWSASWRTFAEEMSVGTSRTFTDSPDEDAVVHHMPDAIRDLLATADTELLITNAYIIPEQKFVDRLAEMHGKGVKVGVLTNSLATHDVPAVNSHYKQWREPLLRAGVNLYEMRPDAEIRGEIADRPPVSSGFMGLHTKAIVVDRKRAFIGSMNLDPRSSEINSEMGVIIDSPALADKLAAVMRRNMMPGNSWHVLLSPDGALRWVSAEEMLDIQPARDWLQRVEDEFFMLFPKDYY